jgi:hypothetical protein
VKPRAVPDPVDALGATLVDLQSRVRALEVVSHRHTNTHGAFHSTVDQTAALNTATAMTFNVTDLSYGIAVTGGSLITLATPGVYVLNYSVQLHNTGGGGAGIIWETWLAFNGAAYPASAAREHVANGQFVHFSQAIMGRSLNAGDTVEIYWRTNNTAIRLEAEAASAPLPSIPSVIASIGRIPGTP